MVSQGSECDSDCVPGFMQDLSDGEDLVSRREVEDYQLLISSENGANVVSSVSWGIPVVEDDGDSDANHPLEDDKAAIERETVNRVAQAVFAINKVERFELIELRKKMQEMKNM